MAQARGNRQERRRAKKLAQKTTEKTSAPRGSNATDAEVAERLMAIEQLRVSGQVDAAMVACRQLNASHGYRADVHFAMGVLHREFNQNDAAYTHLKQAVTLEPERADYWLRFSVCLYDLGHAEAAHIAVMNAVQRNPNDVNALLFMAIVCRDVDDAPRALQACDAALSLQPGDARALFGRARALMIMGRVAEAEDAFVETLNADPRYFTAYQNLLKIKSTRFDPERLRRDAMAYIAGQPAASDGLISAYFALGMLEERDGNSDAAMEAYIAGNRLQFERKPFKRGRFREKVDELIEHFTPALFETLRERGSDSERPIFIVGMPRSGTTLTEQILSSHSKVFGAGELKKVSHIARALRNMRLQGFSYPRDLVTLNAETLQSLADDYLRTASVGVADDIERIVDKMPGNIINVGLIAVLFPHARFIHCMRDPMDTAVSCFSQHFKDDLSYTNDLSALGFYYRHSLRLMDHWKKVLPGRIMEVRYEDTIADQEAMSHRIIAHAGLDWEEQCLDFHKTDRQVRTASVWQVRQPIYKTSVERWRRYEKHLGPLMESLAATD